MTRPPLNKTEARLCAWIHACSRSLCEKLGYEVLSSKPSLGEKEFTEHVAWHSHKRLEVNPQHDNVSRGLYVRSKGEDPEIQLQIIWATRLMFNKRGALFILENEYKTLSDGKDIFKDKLEAEALKASLRNLEIRLPLDNACAGMRRNQWKGCLQTHAYSTLQHSQRYKFGRTWLDLRDNDIFTTVTKSIRDEKKLDDAKNRLQVKNDFLWMLVMRDLEVLWFNFVTVKHMEQFTVVGGGAEPILKRCNFGRDKNDTSVCQLISLHTRLKEHLDKNLIKYIAPRSSSWTLDMTENACCELRRWDEAKEHRIRKMRGVEIKYRNRARCKDMLCLWELLGYKNPPPCCHRLYHEGSRDINPKDDIHVGENIDQDTDRGDILYSELERWTKSSL